MQLQNIAEQAKRSPEMVCNNVLHVIDRAFLLEASRQTRKRSAPGAATVTAKPSADTLADTLRDLPERWRDHRYVAPPVERVWIEKEGGKKRPRGKPCFEDKIVQRAVVMIVEAIFAHDFHAFSHGFRKGTVPIKRCTSCVSRAGSCPSPGEERRRSVDVSTTWTGAICVRVSSRGEGMEAC
jgi:retron-type reverse transcriptase